MPSASDKRPSGREVAERIRSKREQIVDRWVRRMQKELPAARRQDRTALIDSLPVLLGELSDVLTDDQSLDESSLRFDVLGRTHGLSRSLMDEYDLDQVTTEYQLLLAVVLETLEEESPIGAEARGVVLRAIQRAKENASAEFRERRQAERKKIEGRARAMAAEVADREQLYDAILDATSNHVFVLSRSERLLYVNRAAASVHGRPRHALLGLTAREFWEHSDPTDQFEANVKRALRGEHVVKEHLFLTPAGRRSFEYALSPVLNERGEVEAVVGISRDISDRKQAEWERERFFQITPDMLCIAGLDTYLKRVNPAFTTALGWSEEELLSRPFLAFVHPDDVPATLTQLERCRQGIGAIRFENRYRCRDGSYRWLMWSAAAVLEEHVMYAAARDVTDAKIAQAENNQRMQFEQQLIGIVSHDLRNPISAIVLGTQALIRREELDGKTRRAVAQIHASAERTARMIRDLLDFTQARLKGHLPVHCTRVDLHALVRQTLMEVEAAHPGRQLEHRRTGDGHGEWDPDRLVQVVTNLVTNALKYSPEGTPVTIETRGQDQTMVLSIHNEGEPIAADRQGHLFEPLQRATSQLDVAGRSVGLGLYIVKQIVDAHGGTIRVQSAERAGTTFTVELPRNACSTRQAASQQ